MVVAGIILRADSCISLFVRPVGARAGSPRDRRSRGVRLWLSLPVGEESKGIWWMPWRQEAMKDVARCEKLGGAASRL